MAYETINYPATPIGYPTAVTILSVIRTDTGASVAATIAAVGGVDGAWLLTITEPLPGLTYQYSLLAIFVGSTGVTNGFVTGQTTPVGYYTSYSLLVAKYGATNIAKWSNTDNDSKNANLTNIQLGIGVGEDQLNEYFFNGAYSTPLTPLTPMIVDWATTVSAFWIYTTRGLMEDDEVCNRLQRSYTATIQSWAAYKGGALYLPCQRRWPSPTAAVAARGYR